MGTTHCNQCACYCCAQKPMCSAWLLHGSAHRCMMPDSSTSIFHEQQNGHNGGTKGWDFHRLVLLHGLSQPNVGQTQFALAIDYSSPG